MKKINKIKNKYTMFLMVVVLNGGIEVAHLLHSNIAKSIVITITSILTGLLYLLEKGNRETTVIHNQYNLYNRNTKRNIRGNSKCKSFQMKKMD
jgi:hypothetical protein